MQARIRPGAPYPGGQYIRGCKQLSNDDLGTKPQNWRVCFTITFRYNHEAHEEQEGKTKSACFPPFMPFILFMVKFFSVE